MIPRPLLGLYFLVRAGEFRLRQPAPHGAPFVKVPGPNPLRVLVAGAGMAYGYGVPSYDAALAGPLARRLAEQLGRGVVVETRARAVLPMNRAIGFLGLNGAHTFDAVVFAPCYLEARSAPGRGLKRHLPALLAHLRATGTQRLEIVVSGFPRPLGSGVVDESTTAAVTTVNRIIAGIVRDEGHAHFVEPAPFASMRSDRPFDPALYAETANRVADVLAPRFARPHP